MRRYRRSRLNLLWHTSIMDHTGLTLFGACIHCPLHIAYFTPRKLNIAHCTLYIVHCTLHTAVHTAHCTLHTVNCIVPCTLCTEHCTVHCTMRNLDLITREFKFRIGFPVVISLRVITRNET